MSEVEALREIAGMRRTEDEILALFAGGEPVIFVFGIGKATKAYALPIGGSWDGVIGSMYDGTEPAFRTTPRKLKEAHVVRLLSRQVDEDFLPLDYGILVTGEFGKGNSYGYVEAAYLVPFTLWWKKRIAAEIKRRGDE